MKIKVTLYKDQSAVYTDGVESVIDSYNFTIRDTGYISTVNPFDFKPDLNFPHIFATELSLNDGRVWYVSETRAEIEEQMRRGLNLPNMELIVQFTIGVTAGAPADGATDYVNALVNGEVYIEKNGTGYLLPSEFDLLPGGGFELLGGAVFSNDETYTVYKVV